MGTPSVAIHCSYGVRPLYGSGRKVSAGWACAAGTLSRMDSTVAIPKPKPRMRSESCLREIFPFKNCMSSAVIFIATFCLSDPNQRPIERHQHEQEDGFHRA